MNKYYIVGLIVVILVLILSVFEPFKSKEGRVLLVESKLPTPTQTISTILPSGAEKIEVLHFHASKQCMSCINIGKFTKATIEEKFPEEFKSGKIVFREINIDLPENYVIAQDYKVSGSALFINVVKDGQGNKEEDTTVWRLVTNETQFKDYFEEKLKTLL
jgi:hypothetical protein